MRLSAARVSSSGMHTRLAAAALAAQLATEQAAWPWLQLSFRVRVPAIANNNGEAHSPTKTINGCSPRSATLRLHP